MKKNLEALEQMSREEFEIVELDENEEVIDFDENDDNDEEFDAEYEREMRKQAICDYNDMHRDIDESMSRMNRDLEEVEFNLSEIEDAMKIQNNCDKLAKVQELRQAILKYLRT